jgi:hypothetical protein
MNKKHCNFQQANQKYMLRIFMFVTGNLLMFATYEVLSMVLLRSWTALFWSRRHYCPTIRRQLFAIRHDEYARICPNIPEYTRRLKFSKLYFFSSEVEERIIEHLSCRGRRVLLCQVPELASRKLNEQLKWTETNSDSEPMTLVI